MARIAQLLFSFAVILLSSISRAQEGPFFPNAAVLPVTKDVPTNQYVTQIYMGNESVAPVKLVLDLAGLFSWIDFASSSHQLISCFSLQCSMAKANAKAKASSCNRPSREVNDTCILQTENPITRMVTRGELTEDIISIRVNDGIKTGSLASIPHFLMSSVPASLLRGFGNGVKGVLSLGNTGISLPSQVAVTFGFQRKFSVCLSSSNGVVLLGESAYISLPNSDAAKSLMYTPLIFRESSKLHGYYIEVKSIRISGKKLAIKEALLAGNQGGIGGTKISTTDPYSTMETTLYHTFTEAYVRAAIAMNMTVASPVEPFGVCFNSEGIEKKRAGPNVPVIDLVLQSEMVKWRIHGSNSMVHVSDKVMCLGFLDGGLNSKASIVLGGHQLEDKLLEFNLGTSMLGFSSSSLLMEHRSCSDFRSRLYAQ